MIEPQSIPEVIPQEISHFGKYRWTILSLVFFATTINYLDRQVISLLKDDYLAPMFHWNETDYANIVVVFQVAYAFGMLGVGWVIDKVGTKMGYALALAVWSIAAICHSAARNTLGFMADRKSTRLNSSHLGISYAVFCLKKKKKNTNNKRMTLRLHLTHVRTQVSHAT